MVNPIRDFAISLEITVSDRDVSFRDFTGDTNGDS